MQDPSCGRFSGPVTDGKVWRILTPRHAVSPTLEGHLTFALKYEGLDLAVRQNNGRLSKRARESEFLLLTDLEVARTEEIDAREFQD